MSALKEIRAIKHRQYTLQKKVCDMLCTNDRDVARHRIYNFMKKNILVEPINTAVGSVPLIYRFRFNGTCNVMNNLFRTDYRESLVNLDSLGISKDSSAYKDQYDEIRNRIEQTVCNSSESFTLPFIVDIREVAVDSPFIDIDDVNDGDEMCVYMSKIDSSRLKRLQSVIMVDGNRVKIEHMLESSKVLASVL
jgi:hypothetical protein